jgi:hypothetical protein
MEHESENPAVRLNIEALEAIDELVDRLAEGDLDEDQVRAELERVKAKIAAARETWDKPHVVRVVKARSPRAGG